MPTEKKKRKYTFRKGQVIPYESGSLIHETVKAEREISRDIGRVLGTNNKPKRKRKK